FPQVRTGFSVHRSCARGVDGATAPGDGGTVPTRCPHVIPRFSTSSPRVRLWFRRPVHERRPITGAVHGPVPSPSTGCPRVVPRRRGGRAQRSTSVHG